MNLIEQLGGYEQANSKLLKMDKILKEVYYSHSDAQKANELRQALLEYRCEHNMYEVGDKYVMLKLWHDDLMTVEDGEMDEPWWNERIIRHATNEEIKAGRRL